MTVGRMGRCFFYLFGIPAAVSVEARNVPVELWCTCKRTGAVSVAVGELMQMPRCRRGGI
jgi:hypothetical protein